MNLTRLQIVNGNYKWPDNMIVIKPTKHYLEQMKNRCMGLDCIPTQVRVTKDNIHSGKTEDGVHLNSVVVRIKYTPYKYLFICLNPYDGGGKSMWFEPVKRPQKNEKAARKDNK